MSDGRTHRSSVVQAFRSARHGRPEGLHYDSFYTDSSASRSLLHPYNLSPLSRSEIPEAVVDLLPMRRGHFRLESGHHGDLWLDLERLCLDPRRVRSLSRALAQRVATYDVEAICGPLVEGAFVALMVAAELGLRFAYAERLAAPDSDALFAVKYRVPDALRDELRGRRVAIVNDVVNAGSAVRGALNDLTACDARPVVIASLAVLGPAAATLAANHGVALESLASLPNTIWTPEGCPLCAAGVSLENHEDHKDHEDHNNRNGD